MADFTVIPLLALIGDQNLLDEFQLEEVAGEVESSGVSAFQAMVDSGYLDEDTIIQILCDHLGCESMDLKDAFITPDLIEQLPAELAKQHQCVPVSFFEPTLQLAFVDPLNPAALDEIGFTTGFDVQVVVANPAQVTEALKEHYGQDEVDAAASGEALTDILKEFGDKTLDEEDVNKVDILSLIHI